MDAGPKHLVKENLHRITKLGSGSGPIVDYMIFAGSATLVSNSQRNRGDAQISGAMKSAVCQVRKGTTAILFDADSSAVEGRYFLAPFSQSRSSDRGVDLIEATKDEVTHLWSQGELPKNKCVVVFTDITNRTDANDIKRSSFRNDTRGRRRPTKRAKDDADETGAPPGFTIAVGSQVARILSGMPEVQDRWTIKRLESILARLEKLTNGADTIAADIVRDSTLHQLEYGTPISLSKPAVENSTPTSVVLLSEQQESFPNTLFEPNKTLAIIAGDLTEESELKRVAELIERDLQLSPTGRMARKTAQAQFLQRRLLNRIAEESTR